MYKENAINKLPCRYSNLHYDCLQLPDLWILLPLDNSYRTINIRCLLFSKTNSRQENCSNLSFTARIITKYSLKRFLSICGEKMSNGFLKICKLITNLILGLVSNLTNVLKQNSRINYARLH